MKLFKKNITRDDTKKTKRRAEIEVLTKVAQLFKPITCH